MSIANLFENNDYDVYSGSSFIGNDPTINNSNSNFLVRDSVTGEIQINNSTTSYPVVLPTTPNTLTQFTSTGGQVASTTINVTGGNSLSNLQNVVGNDPGATLRMSNIQTSGISEKTAGAGVFVSNKLNYTGAVPTTDTTKNQVIVRDPINVNELMYRNDFVDTSSEQTLSNKTLSFPIISTILNTGQLSLPVNVDDWIVARNTTDTLTNKTLTQPIMSTVRNANNLNRTINLPNNGSTGDTFLTSLSTQQVINKSFNAELSNFYSNAGTNRRMLLDLFNSSDNTSTILNFQQTANRNIFYPDSDGTIILDGTAQNLSNKTISNLTATGTTQSLLSGKQITNYVTLTTTNNTPTTLFTLPLLNSQTLTLEVDFSCICTASTGANLDKARGFSAVYLIKRTSSGVMNQFTITSNVGGDGGGGFGPTLNIVLGPGNFSLTVTGSTGDTINYGGNYCINYR